MYSKKLKMTPKYNIDESRIILDIYLEQQYKYYEIATSSPDGDDETSIKLILLLKIKLVYWKIGL
jgi:hypothetical protein